MCRRSRRALPASIEIFDTTLRDGAQFEGISLTVEDKLRVAEQLDWLGVAWIEGGYPRPTRRTRSSSGAPSPSCSFETATLVAFGSTRRPLGKVDVDPTLAGAGQRRHVDGVHRRQELGLPRHRGARHHARRGRRHGGGESCEFLKAAGLRVFFDAEHFFDGYKANPEYALRVLEAAATERRRRARAVRHQRRLAAARGAAHRRRGARRTSAPTSSSASTRRTTPAARSPTPSPPSLGGATQLQGTVNGYGERTGNANLMTCIPNLELKMGIRCLPEGRLERLTAVSRHVAELVNLPPHDGRPLRRAVGLRPQGRPAHVGARQGRRRDLRAHRARASSATAPGCSSSDLGGRAGMVMKAKEFGVDLDDRAAGKLSEDLKQLEADGYVFEAADASLELLMRRATGWEQHVVHASRATASPRTTGPRSPTAPRRPSTPRPP